MNNTAKAENTPKILIINQNILQYIKTYKKHIKILKKFFLTEDTDANSYVFSA